MSLKFLCHQLLKRRKSNTLTHVTIQSLKKHESTFSTNVTIHPEQNKLKQPSNIRTCVKHLKIVTNSVSVSTIHLQ